MKINLKGKKKIALVLSGGGIKAAAFHVGVCIALKERGFKFAGGTAEQVEEVAARDGWDRTIRLYVGSSAGAVVSTFLASGHSIQSIIDAFVSGSEADVHKFKRGQEYKRTILKPITYRDVFHLNGGNFVNFVPNMLRRKSIMTGGLEALIKNGFKINGLFTTRGIEKYMKRNVWPINRFDALGVELFIVATQLNHSRKVIFGDYPETTKVKTTKYANFATVSEAVAASASLPPVFAPFPIKNQKNKTLYFFDGEIRDTLSTHVAADHGADLVISSYSIQPYHFNKELGSLHEYGIPMIFNQALYQVVEQKIQKHIEFQNQISSIIKSVDGYFRQMGLPDEHREKMIEIITSKTNFNPEVDYIYIHPSPMDHEMFFVDHFSLNPDILSRIVQLGFKSAMNRLRRYNL